jgi:acyl-CoA thioesterase-1
MRSAILGWLAAVLLLAVPPHADARGPAQDAIVIVAVGASNTAGWGVPFDLAYPAQLQDLLQAKGIDAVVRNRGMPGDTTAGMLARLESVVRPGTRLVILQPGTNDDRAGLAGERAGNIEKMRELLGARGIRLIVVENAVLDALPRSELREDGLHFTPAGYGLLAERILPEVLAALGR